MQLPTVNMYVQYIPTIHGSYPHCFPLPITLISQRVVAVGRYLVHGFSSFAQPEDFVHGSVWICMRVRVAAKKMFIIQQKKVTGAVHKLQYLMKENGLGGF